MHGMGVFHAFLRKLEPNFYDGVRTASSGLNE